MWSQSALGKLDFSYLLKTSDPSIIMRAQKDPRVGSGPSLARWVPLPGAGATRKLVERPPKTLLARVRLAPNRATATHNIARGPTPALLIVKSPLVHC